MGSNLTVPAVQDRASSDSTGGNSSNASETSTPALSPFSTPVLGPSEPVEAGASAIVDSLLPPLLREFPKPSDEIDVEQALDRQPGRWTLKGQMEANQRRAQLKDENVDMEQRARAFEKAKQELLASHESLRQQ